MTEYLKILTDEDIDDETLRRAADQATRELARHGVDLQGVAPVLDDRTYTALRAADPYEPDDTGDAE
ncbi:hypothetical protein [Halobaculum sp. P14]|uniref:hypothetical protein n=1 Tax=Halobaculum sp. P14 TaxID=3421638 RepID=UPI003EC089FF